MSRIICIANQKGGVGKTTTAINLAASLAVMEQRTLLIDCDPQANTTSGLGLRREDFTNDLYTIFRETEKEAIQSAIIEVRPPFLHLIPSSVSLVGIEVELVTEVAREHYLSSLLEKVKDDYDFILLDCPPSLGIITLNALCAASELLIPLQCEFFALEGIAKLMDTYLKIRYRLNPQLSILGVLLTMFDSRNRLARDVRDEIRRCMSQYVLETVIPRNVRVSEAPSYGKSIIHYDVKSKGALAYLELAQEVIQRKAIA